VTVNIGVGWECGLTLNQECTSESGTTELVTAVNGNPYGSGRYAKRFTDSDALTDTATIQLPAGLGRLACVRVLLRFQTINAAPPSPQLLFSIRHASGPGRFVWLTGSATSMGFQVTTSGGGGTVVASTPVAAFLPTNALALGIRLVTNIETGETYDYIDAAIYQVVPVSSERCLYYTQPSAKDKLLGVGAGLTGGYLWARQAGAGTNTNTGDFNEVVFQPVVGTKGQTLTYIVDDLVVTDGQGSTNEMGVLLAKPTGDGVSATWAAKAGADGTGSYTEWEDSAASNPSTNDATDYNRHFTVDDDEISTLPDRSDTTNIEDTEGYSLTAKTGMAERRSIVAVCTRYRHQDAATPDNAVAKPTGRQGTGTPVDGAVLPSVTAWQSKTRDDVWVKTDTFEATPAPWSYTKWDEAEVGATISTGGADAAHEKQISTMWPIVVYEREWPQYPMATM